MCIILHACKQHGAETVPVQGPSDASSEQIAWHTTDLSSWKHSQRVSDALLPGNHKTSASEADVWVYRTAALPTSYNIFWQHGTQVLQVPLCSVGNQHATRLTTCPLGMGHVPIHDTSHSSSSTNVLLHCTGFSSIASQYFSSVILDRPRNGRTESSHQFTNCAHPRSFRKLVVPSLASKAGPPVAAAGAC